MKLNPVLVVAGVVFAITMGAIVMAIRESNHQSSESYPGWADNAARAWAGQMKLEPTAIHCQGRSMYDRCDVAVGTTVYAVECTTDNGCQLERR